MSPSHMKELMVKIKPPMMAKSSTMTAMCSTRKFLIASCLSYDMRGATSGTFSAPSAI